MYKRQECVQLGLCNENYVREVLEREQLSSTSFRNGVAVPHSLNINANQSFLSVVINNEEMDWGENKVSVIVMIGTSRKDREAFKLIFDELIAVLYEPENIRELLKCRTYKDFIETLATLITG